MSATIPPAAVQTATVLRRRPTRPATSRPRHDGLPGLSHWAPCATA
jgi:hypothetical protein